MDKNFLKTLTQSLEDGIVDESLKNKFNDLNNLADEKLKNNDFKNLDKINELAKEGYFKDKITEEDLEKSKEENKNLQKQIDMDNNVNNIIKLYLEEKDRHYHKLDEINSLINELEKDPELNVDNKYYKILLEIKEKRIIPFINDFRSENSTLI